MSKVFIEETTLTNIGSAIREKTGKSDLIAPGDMPAEIKSIVSGGGGEGDCNGLHVPEEALTITGSCGYKFAYGGWNWFINAFGDKITTNDVRSIEYMFYMNSEIESVPFEINFNSNFSSAGNDIFNSCSKLKSISNINNFTPTAMDNMFNGCENLTFIPDDFGENWNWSSYKNATSPYDNSSRDMFRNCRKLRKIPRVFSSQDSINHSAYEGYSLYYDAYSNCHSLEEVQLPVYMKEHTSNMFGIASFANNCRLKRLRFNLQEDGTPYEVQWKGMIINPRFGYKTPLLTLKWDFTDDTKITTPEQWHGYQNGTYPDGWADSQEYSVFGKTSATELINTLPDTSAYLASKGGTNTVKFYRDNASAIEGERLGDLSEEVIAVATAKGWTITFI